MARICNTIKLLCTFFHVQMKACRLFPAMLLTAVLICGQAETVVYAAVAQDAGAIHGVLSAPLDITLLHEDRVTKAEVRNGLTVADLLEHENISYDSNDVIIPELSALLEDGDQVVVKRVEVSNSVEREVVPYETVYKTTLLLEEDEFQVLQEGIDGERETTYANFLVDGEMDDRISVDEKVLQAPVEEIILRGGSAPISPLDFGIETDSEGRPLAYRELLTNQTSTAYYAQRGALTASGVEAAVGYVAVNPHRIPYGTKLYIESVDGSFVYGYAIAADTGSALMHGTADVDLFYENRSECIVHGRRPVNVYILE